MGVEHFIRLARTGKREVSSSGEKAARKLALCVIDNAPCLDDSALEGFIDFVRLAATSPNAARDLLEGK